MTVRQVTPAGEATSVTIAWDNSSITVRAGTILDVPPGSALESAYEIGLALAPPPGDDAQRGHAERCGSGTMGGLLCQK